MDIKEIGTGAGNLCTYILAAIQQNEILQIVEFVLSAILTVALLGYRIWHWVREAKKDGKITDDEIDQLGDIIKDAKDQSEGKK